MEKFNTTIFPELTKNPKNINELRRHRDELNKDTEIPAKAKKGEAISNFPLPGDSAYPENYSGYDKYQLLSEIPSDNEINKAEEGIENPEIAAINRGMREAIDEKGGNILEKLREFGSKRAVQAAFVTLMLFSKAIEAKAGQTNELETDVEIEMIESSANETEDSKNENSENASREEVETISSYDISNFKKLQTDTTLYLSENFLEKIIEETNAISEDEAREQVINIMTVVEKCKLKIIDLINREEYLQKLIKEMDISRKEAMSHQKTRISNVMGISYSIKSSEDIESEAGESAEAYYTCGTNKITIPSSMQLNTVEGKKYWEETILHEILHEMTMAEKGISSEAAELLTEEFIASKNESEKRTKYLSDPAELLVRKNILDLELEKLHIKKYGKEFTIKHINKLVNIGRGRLSGEAVELITHTSKEGLIRLMNGIAEANTGSNEKADYMNPGWDYSENQT